MNQTENEILALLKKRYPQESYALFPQVRSSTGGGPVRTADAMCMGLWPSRGLYLEGFEFKRTRADWLKELKSPEKAEVIAAYCDRWWVVVTDMDLIKDGELPIEWGLILKSNKKLITKVKAPLRKVPPIPKSLLASILRCSQDGMIPRDIIGTQISQAYDDGYKRGRNHIDTDEKVAEYKLEKLEEGIKAFEEASGISIQTWGMGRIGKAVKAYCDLSPDGISQRLFNWEKDIQRVVTSLQKAREAFSEKQKIEDDSSVEKGESI